MRTLKFIVEDQLIKPDPSCDFSGLVPGTEGYLRASFTFSPEWNDTARVAAFWSPMGKEYPPKALDNENACMIPSEALKNKTFKVQVIGKSEDGMKLTTNKVTVCQDGGNI